MFENEEEDPTLVPIEKIDEMIYPFTTINLVVQMWYSHVCIKFDDPPEIINAKQKAITHFLQTKLN